MSVDGPRVVAYRARFGVRMADGVEVVEASVPDWMPDVEVFRVLGGAARTLGDLVTELRSGGDPCGDCDGVVCRIIEDREVVRVPVVYESSVKLG